MRVLCAALLVLACVSESEAALRKKNVERKRREKEQARAAQQKKERMERIKKEGITSLADGVRVQEVDRPVVVEKARPFDTPNDLYCDACNAVVAIAEHEWGLAQKHKRKVTQAAIMSDVLDIYNLCDAKNYKKYENADELGASLKLSTGCKAYLADHEDDLEALYVDRSVTASDRKKHFCYNEALGGACLHIPEKPKPKPPTMVEGRDYKFKSVPTEKKADKAEGEEESDAKNPSEDDL